MLQFRYLSRRPDPFTAVRYDGGIDSSDLLIRWVKRHTHKQELYFEGETTLLLHGEEGTSELMEGWWLVKDDENNFEVMTSDELDARFIDRQENSGTKKGTW